MLRQKSSVR